MSFRQKAKIDPDKPAFSISYIANEIGISTDRLRRYEIEGLITPYRPSPKKRLYSLNDIDCIKKIRILVHTYGISIPAIKIMLDFMKLDKILEKAESKFGAPKEDVIFSLVVRELKGGVELKAKYRTDKTKGKSEFILLKNSYLIVPANKQLKLEREKDIKQNLLQITQYNDLYKTKSNIEFKSLNELTGYVTGDLEDSGKQWRRL